MTINVLESELGTIRVDQERHILTDRGEKARATQDAVHLADWILTRSLGPDRAIVELRDGKSLAPVDLVAAVRSMKPWLEDGRRSTVDPELAAIYGRDRKRCTRAPRPDRCRTGVGEPNSGSGKTLLAREYAKAVTRERQILAVTPSTKAPASLRCRSANDSDADWFELREAPAGNDGRLTETNGHLIGRDIFERMVDELWSEDPAMVIGSEPAIRSIGDLGDAEDPWLAFTRLRHCAPQFLHALVPVRARPRRTLRVRRESAPLHQVRRVFAYLEPSPLIHYA